MTDDARSLLIGAQAGSARSLNGLLSLIKSRHMQSQISWYLGRNALVSDADIESAFLVGCWKAIDRAKLEVGDPVAFICWKGKLAVAGLMRQTIRRETRYTCRDCGRKGAMRWKAKVPVCRCGSPNVNTWMVVSNSEEVARPQALDTEAAWGLAVYGIQIDEMRKRLTGRSLELFDIISVEGISAESSRNYLQEIALRWGVSPAAVAAALRRLRAQITAYVEEE